MTMFKKFVKKLNIENRSGIKFKIWLTNEQVYDTSLKKSSETTNFNDSNEIELLPDTMLDFMTNREHARMVMNLFASYDAEEVTHAQIYMHVEVKEVNGSYRRIWNIPVYQTGMQTFKLKREKGKIQSQYFLLNSSRVDTATKIIFESIACVYSKLNFDVLLTAWKPDPKNPNRSQHVDEKLCPRQEVIIIPITWFRDQL